MNVGVALTVYFSGSLLYASNPTNKIEVESAVVDGRSLLLRPGRKVNFGSPRENVVFNFRPTPDDSSPSLRFKCRLDGFENNWREGDGFMFVGIRFTDSAGEFIAQENFQVSGESPGWNGTLKTSVLAHRRETLVVPARCTHASVVISSAGPPATVGIYAVANLEMEQVSSNLQPSILMQSPLDETLKPNGSSVEVPSGWIRDGTHANMAKIIQIGQDPPVHAFAIEDNDVLAHAEWRLVPERSPVVAPGMHLIIEWNEMFSIGVGDFRSITYPALPAGNYRFQLAGLNLMGNPDGAETSLEFFVPRPIWDRPWFWSTILVFVTAAIVGSGRYVAWHRMKREMQRLKNLQVLQSERLRIAHDIHDDLGARVTQITMVSAMLLHDTTLSSKMREDLNQIKRLSRDLVTALYETVWAVNPEYDNLDALGNYLCQMVNQQCDRTGVHCRLNVSELPHDIQVSSQIRHNITMAVKEAINNVIKHAGASKIVMDVDWKEDVLGITIKDNGGGFDTNHSRAGNGLTNMKGRMQNVGGSCFIDSQPGAGTTINFQITVNHHQT